MRFTISFTLEKLFKNITLEGIAAKDIEDTLFATSDRQAIIVRAISAYLRKNVRIQYFKKDPEGENFSPTMPG